MKIFRNAVVSFFFFRAWIFGFFSAVGNRIPNHCWCCCKKALLLILNIHKVIIILFPTHTAISAAAANGFRAKARINFLSSLLFKNVINIKCYFLDLILLFRESLKLAKRNGSKKIAAIVIFIYFSPLLTKKTLTPSTSEKKRGVRRFFHLFINYF